MKRTLLPILAALAFAAVLPRAAKADDAYTKSTGDDYTQDTKDTSSDKPETPADFTPVKPDTHEKHPAYLHALANLRGARWMLKHRHGDWKVLDGEDDAVRDIEKAIGEIRHAAIDDGKDLDDHPKFDDDADHAGRLHRALDLLRDTRKDLEHAEENGHARGLRRRAFRHIDHAIDHVKSAIYAAEHEHEHYDRRHHRDHD